MDELTMLRAAVIFNTKAGRAPRRRDLRPPAREEWETMLGIPLPPPSSIDRAFGSFTGYLAAAGLAAAPRLGLEDIEDAAIEHAQEIYPHLELVTAEANHFDGYLGTDRVEIKGSMLTSRLINGRPVEFFNFKTHNRELHKTIDRLICVGLVKDGGLIRPVARLEFPKSSLALVTRKSTVQIYSTSIWGAGSSQYTPYVVWREHMTLERARELAR